MIDIEKLESKFLSTCKEVDINTAGGYTITQILNNLNCSKEPKYWERIKGTNRFLFNSKMAESWEYFYPFVENPIRNTNQIYLRFKNSNDFNKASNNFKKYGYYVEGREGMLNYEHYWDKEEELCENGLIIDGVRITGRHYFAINFGRINAIPVDIYGNKLADTKIETFLRFLDHQYYLLNELEEAFLEGPFSSLKTYQEWFPLKTEKDFKQLKKRGFASLKARRKGFSYIVDNALYAYNYSFIPSSNSLLFAYEKKNYNVTLRGIHITLNFLNKHTEFGRRKGVLRQHEHFRASYEYIDPYGVRVEEGYMSEIQAKSFKDNPYASVGDSAYLIGVEEAGVFGNLLETYAVSIEPLIRDGEIWIGNFILWGSSGSMESGSAMALREIIYNPESMSIKSYENIYEPSEVNGEVAWFIDDLWYSPSVISKEDFLNLLDKSGLDSFKDDVFIEMIDTQYDDILEGVDKNGNSHRWISRVILEDKRSIKRKGSQRAYDKLITQQPLYISEAFLVNENSPFDTALVQRALAELSTKDTDLATPGKFLVNQDGKIEWLLDLDTNPILEWPVKKDDIGGCWVIYNLPEKINGEISDWRYVAGTDPVDFGTEDSSNSSTNSMAATFIIDTFTRNIVAEYIGRPKTAEVYYENLWRGIEFYNAQLLYENNLKGLYSYFASKNKLYLLADEPEHLKDKWGYNSNNRKKGFHATQQINSFARELIHKWSTESVIVEQSEDEDIPDKTVPRMFFIPSKGILQQMNAWNSKGNFDWVSGLGAAMLLLFDRDIYEDEVNKEVTDRLSGGIFEKVRKSYVKNNFKWMNTRIINE